ncbi:hypothetical protein TanjilG_24989 [Lupinus angustifolius]|uniref:Uncharacterized protein n=1 Tax=Lupinus angustifolius TaxID=3871 RepID=A0A1J7I8J6_LUPAN|nr:hypothetical protein TanjilG_24989 [Lupinus angustifolius]
MENVENPNKSINGKKLPKVFEEFRNQSRGTQLCMALGRIFKKEGLTPKGQLHIQFIDIAMKI